MKNKLVLVCVLISGIFITHNVSEAKPVYNGQNAQTYFNEYLAEAKKNGYIDQDSLGRMDESFAVRKLEREILKGNPSYNKNPQFYLSWTDVNVSDKSSYNRPDKPDITITTDNMNGKRNFVNNSQYVGNQSQLMFPLVKTRYEMTNDSSRGVYDHIVNWYDSSPRKFTYPQGFMYSEADNMGNNKEIKQFVYEKNANGFRVLWNPKTESLILLAKEGVGQKDKVMVVRSDVDEIYRYAKISGELFYFGQGTKQFEVLNQMAYVSTDPGAFKSPAYLTYGKRKGFVIPNEKDQMNIIIRTDVEGIKPENWTIKEYPYKLDGTTWRYKNGTLEEASKPTNFMAGFNANGTGFESDENKAEANKEIVKEYDSKAYWNNSDYVFYGQDSVNSVKMKSAPKKLIAGESMIMGYAFEPTTAYKSPAIHLLPDLNKTVNEDVKTKVRWTDQVKGSLGGIVEVFVQNKLVQEIPYDKKDEVDGDFDLLIEADKFNPGVDNEVKLVIKDNLLLQDPNLIASEHSSERKFKVSNRRIIPIHYQTQFDEPLDVPEGTQKSTTALDKETVKFLVPGQLGEIVKYPLKGVKPTDGTTSIKNNEVTYVGKESLVSSGITVEYTITARTINISYEDLSGEKIPGAPKPEKVSGGARMPYNFGKKLANGEDNPKNKVKDFDKYQFVGEKTEQGNSLLTGNYPDESNFSELKLVLVYKKLNPTVTTNYLQLDKSGKVTNTPVYRTLVDNKERQETKFFPDSKIGEEIALITPPNSFEGYEYDDKKTQMFFLNGTPVTGTKVPDSDFTVNYYYQPLESISVPSDLSFGQNHDSKKDVTYGVSENKTSYINVLNTYENSKWEVLASSNGLISKIDGSVLYADIFYKDKDEVKMISNNIKPITNKKQELKTQLPMSSNSNDNGLFIKVRDNMKKGQFSGQIKFSLQSAP